MQDNLSFGKENSHNRSTDNEIDTSIGNNILVASNYFKVGLSYYPNSRTSVSQYVNEFIGQQKNTYENATHDESNFSSISGLAFSAS